MTDSKSELTRKKEYLYDLVGAMIEFIKFKNLPPHVLSNFSIYKSFNSANDQKKLELSRKLMEKLDINIIPSALKKSEAAYNELREDLSLALQTVESLLAQQN